MTTKKSLTKKNLRKRNKRMMRKKTLVRPKKKGLLEIKKEEMTAKTRKMMSRTNGASTSSMRRTTQSLKAF